MSDSSTDDTLDEALLEFLHDKFGEALVCTRDWSAWGLGGMDSGDFENILGPELEDEAIEGLKAIIDDAIERARQKDRESLLEWITDAAVKYRNRGWGFMASVGYAMRDILGDDWGDLRGKTERKRLAN